MPISTKERITFEAPDGSKWTIRPMTSFEFLGMSKFRKFDTLEERAKLFSDPIDAAVVGWESVSDIDGSPVIFNKDNRPSDLLWRVDKDILFLVAAKVCELGKPTKEEVKNSSSAPSGTAEN